MRTRTLGRDESRPQRRDQRASWESGLEWSAEQPTRPDDGLSIGENELRPLCDVCSDGIDHLITFHELVDVGGDDEGYDRIRAHHFALGGAKSLGNDINVGYVQEFEPEQANSRERTGHLGRHKRSPPDCVVAGRAAGLFSSIFEPREYVLEISCKK